MPGPVELDATVVGHAELAGGHHLLTLAAGALARLAAPGQFAMVRCAEGWDPYLRRPLPFLRLASATVSFLFQAAEPGLVWLARRSMGDAVSLLGPLGRGFALHAATRRLLLATANGPLAPLLALAELAIARDVSVSLAASAASATALASLIPEPIEVIAPSGGVAAQPVGAVWEAAVATLPWADQAAVSGSIEDLAGLRRLTTALRSGQVHCYLQAPMACGVGWCGSCIVETHRGPRRACTAGPVFDLRELTWT